MANYQELLSRAVNALPENSGASRREVYEKARKALVTQLRAISPPLAAREITRHRLELEDCIRQVEYDATEALLGDLKGLDEETIVEEAIAMDEELAAEREAAPTSEPESEPEPEPEPEPGYEPETGPAAEKDQNEELEPGFGTTKTATALAPGSNDRENDKAPAPGAVEGTKEAEPGEEAPVGDLERQLEGSMVPASEFSEESAGHEHRMAAVGQAMSRVREVEVEQAPAPGHKAASHEASWRHAGASSPVPETSSPPAPENAPDEAEDDGRQDVAQKVVDRAIEVLDREARGDHVPIDEIGLGEDEYGDDSESLKSGEGRSSAGVDEERGGNALTIFLVLAIVLLGSVGGGGYWAWREGYVDLDALFSASGPETPGKLAPDTSVGGDQQGQLLEGGGSGPGNTATDTNPDAPVQELVSTNGAGKLEDRLPVVGDGVTAGDGTTIEAANPVATLDAATLDVATLDVATPGPADVTDANKSEERLTTAPVASEPTLGTDQGANNGGALAAGTQSLLLEASADGTTGAVPFSGTVEWSRGVDELGQPTLIGSANIPARNLGVKVLIRRNADPTLPASHLMEIDFSVTPTFVGGAVAGLPGILLKNEELVQGTALVGASARVVGNSFLFALSAAEQDVRTNINLLKTQKWMDLAIIYATGRRAIITLEKDAAAQKMFDEVLVAWQSEAEAAAAKAAADKASAAGNTKGSNP